MSVMPGLTSAIGEVLSELGGFRATRLQSQLSAEARVATGIDTAISSVGGTIITLSSGTFPATVTAGQLFRDLSGAYAQTVTDIIVARLSDTQVQLAGGVFDPLTAATWEIVSPADTAATVETTLGWAAEGQVIIEGVRYAYTGITPTQLIGLSYDDGEGNFISGAKQDHAALTPVVDYTRVYSAIDTMRRSFIVDYATGSDLNVLGRNLGVPRPPYVASDAVYRELIKAMAYVPRGTIYALELMLTALFGAGNFTIFEDMTLGSSSHPAEVVIDTVGDSTKSAGKTFVEETERRILTAPTATSILQAPIRVSSVKLAAEGQERIVASGVFTSGTPGVSGDYDATDDEVSVTGPTGTFPATAVLIGDAFHVTGKGVKGIIGVVNDNRPGDTAKIIVGPLRGSPNSPKRRSDFANVDWKITREKTNARHYFPSEDLQIELPGGPSRQIWEFQSAGISGGGPTEGGINVFAVDSATFGEFTAMSVPNLGDHRIWYRQQARVLPESIATFDVNVGTIGDLSSVATDGEQAGFRMSDGERMLAVGFIRDGSDPGTTSLPNVFAGFIDGTGAFIDSNRTYRATSGTFHNYTIRKHARRNVELTVDGSLVHSAPHDDFAAAASSLREFGIFATTARPTVLEVKHADWSAETPKDFWNFHVDDGSASSATRTLIDDAAGNPFSGAVAGDLVRVTAAPASNADEGNALGEWEVLTISGGGNSAVVQGRAQTGVRVDPGALLRIRITEDDRAFVFPDNLGHQITILDGVNAGTVWTIDKLLDPESGVDLLEPSGTPLLTRPLPRSTTSLCEVTPQPAPAPQALAPQVGGTWRLLAAGFPAPTDPDVVFEVVDQGTVVGTALTLPQSFPIAPYGTGDGPLLEVQYSRVLTGQILREDDDNSVQTTPPAFDFYPFYLADDLSWVVDLLDRNTVAGVHADLHRLFIDDAGNHII